MCDPTLYRMNHLHSYDNKHQFTAHLTHYSQSTPTWESLDIRVGDGFCNIWLLADKARHFLSSGLDALKSTQQHPLPGPLGLLLHTHKKVFHLIVPLVWGRWKWLTVSWTCGLEVACWPMVPKFAGSDSDFSEWKNPQHAFLRKGSKAVCSMSHICVEVAAFGPNYRPSSSPFHY